MTTKTAEPIKLTALVPGTLYAKYAPYTRLYKAQERPTELVLCLAFEKKPPIYHTATLLFLEKNLTEQYILDKFTLRITLDDFIEVTDEEQINATRVKFGNK